MRTAYIHEDDLGEVEILPLEAFESCAQEQQDISQFSDEHRDPNGYGWTDVFVRSEPKKKLIELHIAFADVERAIGSSFSKFDRVETGYGSHSEPLQNAHAYGESFGTVFYVIFKDGLVENIWIRPALKSAEEKADFVKTLRNIGSLSSLIMCDWSLGTITRLANQEDIDRYLLASDEQAERMREALEKYRKEAAKSPFSSNPKRPWWKFWG